MFLCLVCVFCISVSWRHFSFQVGENKNEETRFGRTSLASSHLVAILQTRVRRVSLFQLASMILALNPKQQNSSDARVSFTAALQFITWSKDMSVISEMVLIDMWVRLGTAAASGRSKAPMKKEMKHRQSAVFRIQSLQCVWQQSAPKHHLNHLPTLWLRPWFWLKYLLRSSCLCSAGTSDCRSDSPETWYQQTGWGGSRWSWPGQPSGRRPAGWYQPPCRHDWSHAYRKWRTWPHFFLL